MAPVQGPHTDQKGGIVMQLKGPDFRRYVWPLVLVGCLVAGAIVPFVSEPSPWWLLFGVGAIAINILAPKKIGLGNPKQVELDY